MTALTNSVHIDSPVPPPLTPLLHHLQTHLTPTVLTECMACLHAIKRCCTGDGAGLSGGIFTDQFLSLFFAKHVPTFVEFHNSESDCKILEKPLSLKKINGKSTIALSWSKNPADSKKRETFETDLIVVNLKSEKWWVGSPKNVSTEDRASNFFTTPIPAGIYILPKEYCKSAVSLKSNNKTDTLIDQVDLYRLLKHSMDEKMFLPLPTEFPALSFNLLRAFEPSAATPLTHV